MRWKNSSLNSKNRPEALGGSMKRSIDKGAMIEDKNLKNQN